MKSTLLLLAALSLGSLAAAQTVAPVSAPSRSAAQASFDSLKTLAGEWEGPVTLDPPLGGDKLPNLRVVMRVTSKGNAIVHEMQTKGEPFWMRSMQQATESDHPVTMLYLDGGQLNLVHYCDAGNRPHMVEKASEGRKIAFDFVDISGSSAHGYMHGAAFTLVDADHHSEDWIFLMPGDKLMRAHVDLHRVN